jgi:hypothetical protein
VSLFESRPGFGSVSVFSGDGGRGWGRWWISADDSGGVQGQVRVQIHC